jgi:hypothetical protein
MSIYIVATIILTTFLYSTYQSDLPLEENFQIFEPSRGVKKKSPFIVPLRFCPPDKYLTLSLA